MVSVTSIVSAIAASALSSAAAAGSVIAPVRGRQPSSLAPRPIHYNIGAPVVTDPIKVHLIYYGDWTASQKSLVETFIKGIGASKWWDVERKYYFQKSANASKTYISNQVSLGSITTDDYSLGKSLEGDDLPNLIQSKIDAGALPEDTNAVYFVMTAGDVDESGGSRSFCTDYCGYHSSTRSQSGKDLLYAMVGLPTACVAACVPAINQNVSPNNDIGVDAVLSVVAHELAEAASDPMYDSRAWEDNVKDENADKCAYNYGKTLRDANGARYNMGWGGRNYLIQQNWDPVKQACALSA
ncbi:hypothetical protein HK105_203472 [Polyrhizophydium stewartii]|uniref:Phosphate-induced protein 1 conserved region-domain-containing protein n=1 Tax=Polyrhizophydium stewartii TaxID=2732419 RepID=A0ABR4NC03_9FUNG|nr:hypothetical protein HK105_000062 [Polyrhizophydium stewartii]